MPLTMESWQEDSLDPGPQYPPPGSDTQASPRGMTEEPVSMWAIYSISDNPSPSSGGGDLQLGYIHQVGHSNSVKTPTDIKLYAATLDSPSG